MTARRLNPEYATDESAYAYLNAQRDTSWWMSNNNVWAAIDWLAKLSMLRVRAVETTLTIPKTGTRTYTATAPCFVVVDWHIVANTNGWSTTYIKDVLVSEHISGAACHCMFTETWFLSNGETISCTSSSNSDSTMRVIRVTTKPED